MYHHHDRERSSRVHVEVRGRVTRFTLELRGLSRPERERAQRTVEAFAEALARRLETVNH